MSTVFEYTSVHQMYTLVMFQLLNARWGITHASSTPRTAVKRNTILQDALP